MITKPFFGAILVLVALLIVITTKVQTNNPPDIKVETIGLDDLGIRLETPYGSKSPRHVLLVNDSQHHLLACDLVFEVTTTDGVVSPARKIVAFSYLLKAAPDVRKKLMISFPGIAPRSKMLLGLGVEPDQVRITSALPKLESSGLAVTLKDSVKIDKLIIRLDAVVLENGDVVGPRATEFLTELNDLLLKEKSDDKE